MWVETDGDGARFDLGRRRSSVSRARGRRARCACTSSPTRRPPRACAATCALTGLPALLPEWAYGHWKSRDVYEHQDDVEDDFDGYRRHGIPLDAIVIDSPWETQYNTWEFNPHQFPDAARMIARLRARRRAHRRLGDAVGEPRVRRRPAPARPRVRAPAPRAGAQLRARARAAGHFVATADGEPFVGALVDGHRLARRLHLAGGARSWWREQARRVLDLGVEGIKADDGEGYYFPPDVRFADGRTRRRGGVGATAALYRRSMQRALDEVAPRQRRAVRPLAAGPASRRSG